MDLNVKEKLENKNYMNVYFKSLAFGVFEFFKFLLVSSFLDHGGFVGSMSVVSLVGSDEWVVNGVIHGEGG